MAGRRPDEAVPTTAQLRAKRRSPFKKLNPCGLQPPFDYYGYIPHEREPFLTWMGFLASIFVTGVLLLYVIYVIFLYFTAPYSLSYSATEYHNPDEYFNPSTYPPLPQLGLELRLNNNTPYYDERYMNFRFSNRYILGGDAGVLDQVTRYRVNLPAVRCDFKFKVASGEEVSVTHEARCPAHMSKVNMTNALPLQEGEAASLPEIRGTYTDAVYVYLQADLLFNYSALQNEPELVAELSQSRVALMLRYRMVDLNGVKYSSTLKAQNISYARRFDVTTRLLVMADVFLSKREIEMEDSVIGIKALGRDRNDLVFSSMEAQYADMPAYNFSLPPTEGTNPDASRHFAMYLRVTEYDAQVRATPEVNLFEVFGNIGGLGALLGLVLGLPVGWYNRWHFHRLLKRAIEDGDLGGAVLDEQGRVRLEDANDVVCTLRRREGSKFQLEDGSVRTGTSFSQVALLAARKIRSAGAVVGIANSKGPVAKRRAFRSSGGRLERVVNRMEIDNMVSGAGVAPTGSPDERSGRLAESAAIKWASKAGVLLAAHKLALEAAATRDAKTVSWDLPPCEGGGKEEGDERVDGWGSAPVLPGGMGPGEEQQAGERGADRGMGEQEPVRSSSSGTHGGGAAGEPGINGAGRRQGGVGYGGTDLQQPLGLGRYPGQLPRSPFDGPGSSAREPRAALPPTLSPRKGARAMAYCAGDGDGSGTGSPGSESALLVRESLSARFGSVDSQVDSSLALLSCSAENSAPLGLLGGAGPGSRYPQSDPTLSTTSPARRDHGARPPVQQRPPVQPTNGPGAAMRQSTGRREVPEASASPSVEQMGGGWSRGASSAGDGAGGMNSSNSASGRLTILGCLGAQGGDESAARRTAGQQGHHGPRDGTAMQQGPGTRPTAGQQPQQELTSSVGGAAATGTPPQPHLQQQAWQQEQRGSGAEREGAASSPTSRRRRTDSASDAAGMV